MASNYAQVFKTVLQAYDVAFLRAAGEGVEVDEQQRLIDVFGIVTEYHRLLEERLAIQREKRKKSAEARAKLAEEIAARLAAEDKAFEERRAANRGSDAPEQAPDNRRRPVQ
jgi:hypothetical protein